MSRIGKVPVAVPAGVSFSVIKERRIVVEGKYGKMEFDIPQAVSCEYEQQDSAGGTGGGGGVVRFKIVDGTVDPEARAKWGLVRSIVNNMVQGVSVGFTKTLEITGVGYKCSVAGNYLTLYLGHSHDIVYAIPEGITIKCEKSNVISVFGCDKARVGLVASEIRQLRKPEPYKGKGIRYSDEVIRRKEGKKK